MAFLVTLVAAVMDADSGSLVEFGDFFFVFLPLAIFCDLATAFATYLITVNYLLT